MIFYEIALESIPKFLFACSVEVNNYRNRFVGKQDFLEIAICEQGRILYEFDSGEKAIAMPGMLIPVFQDMVCSTFAYCDDVQKHTTVGATVKYRLQKYNSVKIPDIQQLKERIRQDHHFLIPYHTEMDEKCRNAVFSGLKKIIRLNSSGSPCDQLEAVAEWFGVMGTLTEFVVCKLEKNGEVPSPFAVRYVERAQNYIHEHYKETVTVRDVAGNLEISEGYLQRTMKTVTGMSVIEYANWYRVQMAIQMMKSRHLTLQEIACNVGVEDPAYMSRLFKKITGMRWREYFG